MQNIMKNNVNLNQISECKVSKVFKDILVLMVALVTLIVLPLAFENTNSVNYENLVIVTDVLSVIVSITILYLFQTLSKLLGLDLD